MKISEIAESTIKFRCMNMKDNNRSRFAQFMGIYYLFLFGFVYIHQLYKNSLTIVVNILSESLFGTYWRINVILICGDSK